MTSQAHQEMRTATADLTFKVLGTTQAAFDDAIGLFLNSTLGALLDARGATIWDMLSDAFEMMPTTLPGGSKMQLQAIMAPLPARLNRMNITYSVDIEDFSTWSCDDYSSFESMSQDVNIDQENLGKRFIPPFPIDSAITQVDPPHTIVNHGTVVSGISVNASRFDAHKSRPTNSVNPAWRDAATDIIIGMYVTSHSICDYSVLTNKRTRSNINRAQGQTLITDILLPELEDLTLNGGASQNETDPHQPDWKFTFYSGNYDQLLRVKSKYDPKHIFHGTTDY
ncbi:FAD/FMN-containing dehydrogenase [Penicillium sp. IBT 16267x]|nr:FAD/FMN-containing dehydrogenase [Penicillium sp. IBT 16267x]